MKIDIFGLEKKVIYIAILLSVVHLSLIAFAVFRLGITVPGCVLNPKPFEKAEIIKHGDKRYELRMIAKMWAFEPKIVRLPVGSTLEIFMTSKDVNHGFQIVGTNINVMAVPGVMTQAEITFNNPGAYRIVCNEFCGIGHQEMNGVIEIDPNIEEPQISNGYQQVAAAGFNLDEHPGKKAMDKFGCVACHSLDGSVVVGPSFKGLFGKREEMASGEKVLVDETYLRASISDPQKQVVKGFSIQMPVTPMTPEELNHIVELIKAIK